MKQKLQNLIVFGSQHVCHPEGLVVVARVRDDIEGYGIDARNTSPP